LIFLTKTGTRVILSLKNIRTNFGFLCHLFST